MDERDWAVGIAEFKVAHSPDRLIAFGLGSCVGVALYDPGRKVGGLSHFMLPTSRLHSEVSAPGKYADTSIEALLAELKKEGVPSQDLQAKLVGGANMFSGIVQSAFPVGARNVAAAREKLAEKKIPILAEEVGGGQGRTMVFSLENGKVEIRKFNKPVVVL
jgi:chemotaxis protein CheD